MSHIEEPQVKLLQGVRVLDLSRMVAGGVAACCSPISAGRQGGSSRGPAIRFGSGPRTASRSGGSLRAQQAYITLNLKDPKGRDLLQRLVPRFDVVMESFVPGTLERMGLGWDVLNAWNPRLILARISGWGQTGPASQRPGFGTLIEAASGFAAMNGEPDGGPIVPSFPLADMTSALYTVNAVMFALYHRDVHNGAGQIVDVALFESLFSLLGPLAAEYEVLGTLRQRNGSRSKNAGPRGCYQTSDGRFIAVSGSTPKMAERFLVSYGLGSLLADERFATNEARVDNGAELDEAIERAIASRTL